MKLPRRTFLYLSVGAAALPVMPSVAAAQTYPSRQVRMLVGFATGGAADANARIMANGWRSASASNLSLKTAPGPAATLRLRPSSEHGRMALLTCTTANAVNASLYERLDCDFIRDVAPVDALVRAPLVLIINPTVPTKNVAEFVDTAADRCRDKTRALSLIQKRAVKFCVSSLSQSC